MDLLGYVTMDKKLVEVVWEFVSLVEYRLIFIKCCEQN
jgi:hypothetical protein